ncbi:MAG: cupin [Candidatus Accumulibacter meliphilus]|jgi:anti-sigma factor ChrR (cupin superfamily)|uniref:Cupin n=1 Tax=Candidatus Accumulibacter meliphilus TaxID=2211374 RepID=A0A369XNS6_9PROT|nr:MAG: cupin [Candidatus Accumulibacter meliphilus]
MLNMNFAEAAHIDTATAPWQASPMPGVWRKPLAREDAERGHATSIVRYDAGARFAHHQHPGGEEILVLEGVFSDEAGDYGPGSYLRNPPGSGHAPFSAGGCVLFVKLHQFAAGDTASVRIDTASAAWLPGQGGLQVMPLHAYEVEHVALVKWPAGERFVPHRHWGGEEIFVLSGEFIDEHGRYPAGSWLRSPHLSAHCPYTEVETVIWVKTGHLPSMPVVSGVAGTERALASLARREPIMR